MEQRPTSKSPEVIAAAAIRVLEAIEHLRGFKADVKVQLEVLPALEKALATHSDAFDRAQLLFAAGLGPCQDMVDILNSRSGHERLALWEAETAWVLRTGIRFPCGDGARITAAIRGVAVLADVIAVRQGVARAIVKEKDGARYDLPAEHCMRVWGNDRATSEAAVILRENIGFQMVGG